VGRPDYWLLALVAVLVIVGLQAVYSASFVLALTQYGSSTYFVARQALWAVIGAVSLLVCMKIDYHHWKTLSSWLLVGTVIALVVVLVPGIGISRYGATRWLQLGPIPPVQPSEFAKLALIIYVSALLATKGEKLRRFSSGFVPFIITMALVAGLVILEPDMGTTVILVLSAATVFFLAGADLKHLILLATIILVALALFSVVAGYRSDRWDAFFNAEQDPLGKGFHIIQLLIALGSGGITGLGLGASRQKFLWVPSSHTDGIFAIIGEELGFVGCLLIIALFVALAYRGFRLYRQAPDTFGALLAAGITCWISYQTLINIAGITRSIPLTGIPLPFISSGGSSLAVCMAGIGILLNISRQVKAQRSRRNGGIPGVEA